MLLKHLVKVKKGEECRFRLDNPNKYSFILDLNYNQMHILLTETIHRHVAM